MGRKAWEAEMRANIVEPLLCAGHHNPGRSALFTLHFGDEEAAAQIGEVTYPSPPGQ